MCTDIKDIRRIVSKRLLKLELRELAHDIDCMDVLNNFKSEKITLWELVDTLEKKIETMPDEFFKDLYGEEDEIMKALEEFEL